MRRKVLNRLARLGPGRGPRPVQLSHEATFSQGWDSIQFTQDPEDGQYMLRRSEILSKCPMRAPRGSLREEMIRRLKTPCQTAIRAMQIAKCTQEWQLTDVFYMIMMNTVQLTRLGRQETGRQVHYRKNASGQQDISLKSLSGI